MRRILAALFLLVCPIARAHHLHATAAPGGISPCTKFDYFAKGVPHPDFQKVDWPAIKGSAEAKLYFSQGITQYYGFNYEEAMRNFKKAKEIDAKMAMASWGIALAAGPNINLGMDDACHKLAIDEIKRADSLASGQGLEKDLIQALKQRYVYPPTESAADACENYSEAMAEIWKNRKYKDDPNVGALYAESMSICTRGRCIKRTAGPIHSLSPS